MNQLVISKTDINNKYHRDPIDKTEVVVLDFNFPHEEGDMINSTAEKIKIAYALTWAVKYQYDNDKRFPCKEYTDNERQGLYNYKQFQTVLFEVLDKHSIKYAFPDYDLSSHYLSANITDQLEYVCALIGLTGVSKAIQSIFNDPDTLERFLFNQSSVFTWGFANDWPGSTWGYTKWEISDDKFDILEI